MTALDPKSPLVLDLRALALQRRPGSMVEIEREFPGPDDLGVPMARVPAGSPVLVQVRLESVLEGVLVTGTADVEVVGECARCLEGLDWDETVEFRELFVYPATDARDAVVEAPSEDDGLAVIENECIDLEPLLRDALIPALPMAPLCDPDCAGLCPTCGVRLDNEPGHAHEQLDPRWAALAELLEQPDK
ncbi:MAG: YceD family protein [Actinomycetales bacterium]